MAGDLQRDGVKFCRSIFDTVRKMSADGLGVTRQGYSTTETEVLDYLKMIGQELGLEINTDLAGNVWMCLPGKNRDLPAFVAGSHADSVPQNEHYLSALLRPLLDGSAQIVYAQQIPRKDARPLIRKDYRRAFGDGSVARTWRHFFSIAAAAAPRKLLTDHPFREDLQYSEDVEWSWRMKQQGCRIAYAEDATVEHSHNYDLKQTAKRFYNEGIADAMIFRAPCGFFGTFLLPLCRELLRDISFLFREHELADAPYELTFRILQRWNHYRGYRRGESCRE